MPLEIGTAAPDFQLLDTERNPFTLDDLKGRKSLIVFIPFPFTGICQDELCALRDDRASLDELDANVVAITTTPLPSVKAWAEQNGFGFPVLSDFWPHGQVASLYENFDDRVGAATRTTYVLDGDGIIRDVIASDSLGTAREHDLYAAALAKL